MLKPYCILNIYIGFAQNYIRSSWELQIKMFVTVEFLISMFFQNPSDYRMPLRVPFIMHICSSFPKNFHSISAVDSLIILPYIIIFYHVSYENWQIHLSFKKSACTVGVEHVAFYSFSSHIIYVKINKQVPHISN